ncbi:MAG: type IV conjugative transfer system lipoprotein TraV [Pseudomonadota bacterium]
MRHAKPLLAILAAAAVVSGCATKYACNAPEGIPCMSIGEVYKKSIGGTLPATRPASQGSTLPTAAGKPNETTAALATPAPYPIPLVPGTPIRRDPSVLAVWFTPWVDSDGDFHDQSYLYMVTDPGRWLLHENRGMLDEPRRFRRLAPPARQPAPPGASDSRAVPPAMTPEEARMEAADLVGAKDQKDQGGDK